MTDTARRPVIKTHVAWAGWDEHQYRGHRVFAELAGSTSLSGLISIAVSGRRLSPDDERVLDDLAVCLAVAEPRILATQDSALGRELRERRGRFLRR